MRTHMENVVRCHTDGWITNKKVNITYGNEIGNVKYEGCCKNVTINNCMKVTGNFKL